MTGHCSLDRRSSPANSVTMREVNDRLLPPVGADLVRNILYTVGFMRVLGEHEGAAAVDRNGQGKVYENADGRAAETVGYFDEWTVWGASSERTAISAERVRRIHAAIGKRYSMSPETFVHTVAYFTLQIGIFLDTVGAPGFSEVEKRVQVAHWRAIGALLGVEDMPTTWEGMERALHDYESDPRWFGYTPAAKRSSDALIHQFSQRWFPRGLRGLGRPLILSLHEPHVLEALGQVAPPAPVLWLVRGLLRGGVFAARHLPAPKPVAEASRAC